MNLKPFAPQHFRRRLFGQLWMLTLQFLLGMILNLLGNATTGATHLLYVIILVVHILNAIGLVEGGLYIALKERSKLAWWATAVVTATLASGILTVRTGNDWWSFAMACGFIATSWLNGMLYLKADRQLR